MRELTKSMLGLSWAMSVFSAQQLGRLISPTREAIESAVAEVDEVSRFVQSRLTESMAQQFRAGDEWQRRLVDAAFAAGAPLEALDPRPLLEAVDTRAMINAMDPSQMMTTAGDFVQQTADAVRRRTPGTGMGSSSIN
jgi:hypothetical protein